MEKVRLAQTGEYPMLVYTKTVDSVERVLRLASQTPNILRYLPPSNLASQFASVTGEEIIQINFCGIYYLTVLVYSIFCLDL